LKREEPAVEKAETPEIEFLAPEVEIEPTSFSFKLRQKLEIPSDDQQHRVFISSFSESVPFIYYAVPKISRYAYLQTKLKNEFAFPILPGRLMFLLMGSMFQVLRLIRFCPGIVLMFHLGLMKL
jgi:hypothetical protein